jgi:hypothetical protein
MRLRGLSGARDEFSSEFLSAFEDDEAHADRKLPKVISPVDPCSAWTAKANKRVQFGYGLNHLIDVENAVIVDVNTKSETKALIAGYFLNSIDPKRTLGGPPAI